MIRMFGMFITTIVAVLPLAAQQPPPRVSVSVYAVGYAPELEDIHLRTGIEDFTKVELSTANVIGPFNALVAAGQVAIHGEPVTDGEGRTSAPVVGSARIPEGQNRALIVLIPDPANEKSPYRTIVLRSDAQNFPLGTYRVINLSPHPIRGAVGRTVIEAKPGGLATLRLQGEPGEVLPVRFEYHAGDAWNLLTETRCAVRRDRRWLMCVYRDPRTERLNIRSIPDRTLAPAD